MKCVSYNIQYCKGRDNKISIPRIISEVEGADIIALQEIDRFWPRTGDIDQLLEISSYFSDYYWVFGAGIDLHIEGELPRDNKRRQFGNVILSRSPIIASRHHLLPKYGSTGPLSIQRSAIEATIQCENQMLRIYSVHLTHLSSQTRLPQIDRLLEIHQDARIEGAPVCGDLTGMDWQEGILTQNVPEHAIIMGDFNCQPDSPEYECIVGPVSDYGGHISNPMGFVDAWCETGHDKMSGATSDVNDIPARLDYCFVSAALRHNITQCHVNESAAGSDHLPLWTELDLKKTN